MNRINILIDPGIRDREQRLVMESLGELRSYFDDEGLRQIKFFFAGTGHFNDGNYGFSAVRLIEKADKKPRRTRGCFSELAIDAESLIYETEQIPMLAQGPNLFFVNFPLQRNDGPNSIYERCCFTWGWSCVVGVEDIRKLLLDARNFYNVFKLIIKRKVGEVLGATNGRTMDTLEQRFGREACKNVACAMGPAFSSMSVVGLAERIEREHRCFCPICTKTIRETHPIHSEKPGF